MQVNANEQLKTQELLYEPIRKLSKTFYNDSDFQTVYNEFIELGKNLNDNLKNFVIFRQYFSSIKFLFFDSLNL